MTILAPHTSESFTSRSRLDGVTVEVSRELAPLAKLWRDFESTAAGTFYQTYDWCHAWMETVGRQAGVEPRIVIGRTWDRRPLFLLPLGIRRSGGVRVLEWLTQSQIGYGYGFYDRDFLPEAPAWFASQGWTIPRLAGPADAVHLAEMPAAFHGRPHPLSQWFSFQGRHTSYRLSLAGGFDAVYARKRSAESRRGNRKRDARLAALGTVEFGLAGAADIHGLLDEMFDQQAARLSRAGVHGVFGGAERAFIHRLADGPGNVLLPFHLKVAGRLAATMLGGRHGDTYWALISSLGEGEANRHSPGDAALRRTIEGCCAMGLANFDLSAGENAYKHRWADETLVLHETVRGLTAKGYAWAALAVPAILAKRTIKRSPLLWPMVSAARRRIAGRECVHLIE